MLVDSVFDLLVSVCFLLDNREYISNPIFCWVIKMTKTYCPTCEEFRTDSGNDAWGFVWFAGIPICQRCQSVVEFTSNGIENEVEEIEEEYQEE